MADKEKNTDDVTDDAPKKKGGKLLLLLGLPLTAALFAGIGFGAGWFLYSDANSPMSQALRMIEPADSTPAEGEGGARGMPEQTRTTPEDGVFETTYFSFEEALTTNPQGSRRFIQLGVTLSTQYDAKVMEHVETHQAALRSDMLAVIGSFTEDEMSSRDGRERMAAALRDAINERLEAIEGFGGVEGVFFPSFVLQ
ncbi:MAG: flagellar FliL protein [Roseibaca calidilacus]|uniref:Flagellar protein FliL n=1 Tax=Roseibaca calidilacus TaxID=1666912 RepID=A0A0P7X4N0_9RHOB|nr:flagellar basal body-associated FliL family protein [Roseibaca calidilacus]KPP95544.1 MAG: flagellar FliL protein [Roseibaca calidilacus]CUX82117.1 flagellar FliL protein [Roseibaca calidilacus]